MQSNNKQTSVDDKAKNADLASRFMQELLGSVETLVGIADEFGSRTLADLMYLQQAIIEGGYIDNYPDESSVFLIIHGLPSGFLWEKYIKTEHMTLPDNNKIGSECDEITDPENKPNTEELASGVIISDYLKTRRYNRSLMNSAIKECTPILKEFNAWRIRRAFSAVLVFCMDAKSQQIEAIVNTYVNYQISECEEDESERYDLYLGDLTRQLEAVLVKYYGSAVCFEESRSDCSYKATFRDKPEISENDDFYN